MKVSNLKVLWVCMEESNLKNFLFITQTVDMYNDYIVIGLLFGGVNREGEHLNCVITPVFLYLAGRFV